MMKEMDKRVFKPGAYVYIEGDEDIDEVYIVEKGLVEFKSSTERIRTRGDTAGPGDVFGFISSLSRRPRMESAFARIKSIVIVFTRERFLALLQKKSDIAIKLLDAYAEELRLYDTMIFPLEGTSSAFLPEDERLFNLGKYYHRQQQYANAYYILKRYLELHAGRPDDGEARSILADIETRGVTRVAEPVPEGIYRRYADRQIIFCEHEPGDDLFIIKKGRVKIVKYHADSEIILSVLKEGDIFGELAIVSDKPRNATAVSFGGSVVLPINKDSLIRLINRSSDLLRRIFTAISQRVWFTFIRMEAKFYARPITRVYAFLENKLIEENISLKSREPHTFNFGIDELMKMTNVPAERVSETTMDLMNDHNLTFQLGQTGIENPSLVSSKARYFRSRDHLYDGADEMPERRPAVAEEGTFDERPETEGPPARVAAPAAGRTPDAGSEPFGPEGSLFAEMDEELRKTE